MARPVQADRWVLTIYTWAGGRRLSRSVGGVFYYPNSKAGPGTINIDGGTLTVQSAYLGDYYGGTVSQSGGMVNIGSFNLGYNAVALGQSRVYNRPGTLNVASLNNGPSGGTIRDFG